MFMEYIHRKDILMCPCISNETYANTIYVYIRVVPLSGPSLLKTFRI